MRRAAPERRAFGVRPPGRRRWLALAVALGALAPASGAAVHPPQPAPGRAPTTVLAILDYNRSLCDALAGKVIARWRHWGASAEALEKVRDYLVEHQLSELAAARAAGDIGHSLLPRAREEAGPETGAALKRLADLVRSLCDTVAWPAADREEFEARVRGILDRIEGEEEELGGLLVAPEEELEAALEPYLTSIQLAGVEAQGEYLDYLESLKPKEEGPTLAELMQAWHRRYSAAAAPTKEALGKYLAARGRNDNRAMAAACKELLAAVLPVLRDEGNFELPVRLVPASRGIAFEIYSPLQLAYDEIREMAVDCTAGRSREVLDHLEEMQKQLQIAAQHLARYSLAP